MNGDLIHLYCLDQNVNIFSRIFRLLHKSKLEMACWSWEWPVLVSSYLNTVWHDVWRPIHKAKLVQFQIIRPKIRAKIRPKIRPHIMLCSIFYPSRNWRRNTTIQRERTPIHSSLCFPKACVFANFEDRLFPKWRN